MKKIIAISAIAAASSSFMVGNVIAADAPATTASPGPDIVIVEFLKAIHCRQFKVASTMPMKVAFILETGIQVLVGLVTATMARTHPLMSARH